MTDARAGRWATHEARRRQLETARRFGWRTGVLPLIGVVSSVALWWLVPGDLGPFTAGFVLATAIGLGIWFVVQTSGTADVMMGAETEALVSEHLRPLRARGWLTFDHILFRGVGDVDHVIVGTDVAYAIETKWSADWRNRRATDRLADACRSIAEQAGRTGRFLKGNAGHQVDVRPIVVVRGAGSIEAAAACRSSVPVIALAQLTAWVDHLEDVPADGPAELGAVERLVLRHLERADEHELRDRTWLERNGILRALQLIYGGAVVGLITVVLGMGSIALAWWAPPALSPVVGAIGLVVGRRGRTIVGSGLVLGAVTTALLYGLLLLINALA